MKVPIFVSRRTLALITVGVALLSANGCSRNFWRTQADFDGLNLLEQKQFDPRWDIPRTTVEADQRSRFYDPYNLDFEPLPPDDPAANQYMTWVYGMRGYKSWHRFGESMSVENPQWLANFDMAPETLHDVYRGTDGLTTIPVSRKLNSDGSENLVHSIENLTLGQAIELASLHSRDYQTQLENLFLSSLQLSLDQFQFNVRYLGIGGKTPTGAPVYTDLPGGGSNVAFPTQAGVSQVLPSGGQWIVGLANNTLWLFSGGQNNTSSQSILSYSLVQPLLQGAGRKVILENLTASERNVLYNVRLLARYRKLFFADTVVNTSGGSTSSPAAISATSGTSVVNPTVISTSQTSSVAPGTTVGSFAASGIGPPQGYLGLLYLVQQVLNQREQIEFLRVQTERFQELVAQTPFRRLPAGSLPNGLEITPELAGKIQYIPATRRLRWIHDEVMSIQDRDALLALSDDAAYAAAVQELYKQLRLGVTTLEILQVATQFTAAQVRERALNLTFIEEIDQYKFFLGLPIDMQITVDQSILKPFQLTDPLVVKAEAETISFIKKAARVNEATAPLDEIRALVADFVELVKAVKKNGMDVVEDDFRGVRANTPRRLSKLISNDSREFIVRQLERDEIIFANVQNDFREIVQVLGRIRRDVAEDDVPVKIRIDALGTVKDLREDLLSILQNLRLLQIGERSELITLQDFEMDIDEVVAVALQNRLDLMNARAKVMDSRRNMEVAANRLEAVLNVVVQGNVDTSPKGNHPLDFRGAYSTYQFGLQMTTPIDQMQARNVYRSSLVTYQQARRAYMLLEDQVKYDVRTSWRQLMANRQNFEVSRLNLRQAALQFDINVANNLNPRGGGGGATTTAGQAGTTNLGSATGLNLLNALSAILAAENNLILYWASYERNRINIYRDMDIMQVDERGLWIDPLYQNLEGRPATPAEELENVTPPEPASVQFIRPGKNERSGDGVVRLTQGTRAGQAKVAVEETSRPDATRSRFARWWGSRVAGSHESSDADEGRDRGTGH